MVISFWFGAISVFDVIKTKNPHFSAGSCLLVELFITYFTPHTSVPRNLMRGGGF